MEKYKFLYYLMADIISVYLYEGPDEAKSSLRHYVTEGRSAEEKSVILQKLKEDSEMALNDPTFDWVKVGVETGFIEAIPGDSTWSYNYESWVKNTFAYIVHDFIYPDKILSDDEIGSMRLGIIFLLSEAKGYKEQVTFKELAQQFAKMVPQWSFIKSYNLHFMIGERISHLELSIDHISMENCIIRFSPREPSFTNWINDIKSGKIRRGAFVVGWPPFNTDVNSPFYMKYDRDEWLGINSKKVEESESEA
jgi:hypothetical protein